jgi:hypothetical protein
LCQPEAWKEFRSAWVTNEAIPSLVLLSTDGYANSFRSDEDFLKIGQDYLEIIRQQGIASLAEELPAILTEATQQGSGDDITLAIMQDDPQGAAGTTKMLRPLMTAASKSALIEQLKARHSSQQHKLQELAIRVEQARRDNRRLRNSLLFLLAGAIAIPVVIFRDRIFPHPADRASLAPAIGRESDKPVSPPPGAAPSSAPRHPGMEWLLQLNGKEIALRKGSSIPSSFIHPEATAGGYPKTYARMAWDEDQKTMILINDSRDRWTVSGGRKIGHDGEIKLSEAPVTIVFTPGLTGTLTPAADVPAGESSQ